MKERAQAAAGHGDADIGQASCRERLVKELARVETLKPCSGQVTSPFVSGFCGLVPDEGRLPRMQALDIWSALSQVVNANWWHTSAVSRTLTSAGHINRRGA